jgi:hypothetical protein
MRAFSERGRRPSGDATLRRFQTVARNTAILINSLDQDGQPSKTSTSQEPNDCEVHETASEGDQLSFSGRITVFGKGVRRIMPTQMASVRRWRRANGWEERENEWRINEHESPVSRR